MAEVTEVIKRLIVEAQTRGLDQATADFEKFGATAKQAGATTESSLASTNKAFERVAGSVDPARRQIQALAKDLKTLESGRGKGISDDYIDSLKEARIATAALATETSKMGATAAGYAQMAPRIGLAGHELKNLGFQANDAATMLLSGSSAFQVMATQGGQVLQILQGGGGITANIKELAGTFVGMVTPARVAFGGIAAGAALAAHAMAEHAAATKEFENTLKGIGRGTGATVDQLMAISEAAAKSGDTTVAAARDYVNAFARTGKIGKETLEPLAARVEDFAATIGVDAKQATKTLAEAFANPAKGIDTLGDALGGVNAELRSTIVNMAESGQGAAAQAAMMGVLENNTLKARDALTFWSREWKDLTDQLSRGVSNIGKALSPASPTDKLKGLQEQREALGQRPGAIDTNRLSALDAEIAKIKEVIAASEQEAEAKRKVREAEDRSKLADRAVKGVFPDLEQAEQVENKIKLLTDALKYLEQGYNKMGDAAKAATKIADEQALESLQVRQQAMKGGEFAGQFGEGPVGDRMARRAEDTSNEVAGILAVTQAQREDAAVTTALTAARREGATAAEQYQIALGTLTKMQAQDAAAAQQVTQSYSAKTMELQAEIAAINMSVSARASYMAIVQGEIAAQAASAQGKTQEAAAIRSQAAAYADLAEAAQHAKSAKAASDIRSKAADDLELMRFSVSVLHEEEIERTRLIEIMQGEMQAREAVRQGRGQEVQAILETTRALANQKAELARQNPSARPGNVFSPGQDEFGGMSAEQISRSISQGLEPAAIKNMDAANRQIDAAWTQYRAASAAEADASFAANRMGWNSGPPGGGQASVTAPPGYGYVAWGNSRGRAGSGGGYTLKLVKLPDTPEVAAQKAEQSEQNAQQMIDLRRRAISTAISTTSSAIGKQIQALRDAQETAGGSRQRQQDLESQAKEQENRRQQRIQNYLAAGPSPFEQNADIFYDPKKRMAFAETIAGNTDELLKAQIAQAKAEADAAEGAANAADAQIKALEEQQKRLQEQAELISAGVELSQQEVDGIKGLLNEVANNLPANIADNFARIFSAQQSQVQRDADKLAKSAAGTPDAGASGISGGGSIPSQTSIVLGRTSSSGPYGYQMPGFSSGGFPASTTMTTALKKTGAAIGAFASGGEFTVPGSYGAGDRPFVMGLAGQEKVTIETPTQQRRSANGSKAGPTIENLIVQMPPMTDPIVYLNKRSRPSLGRAIRGAARGMM